MTTVYTFHVQSLACLTVYSKGNALYVGWKESLDILVNVELGCTVLECNRRSLLKEGHNIDFYYLSWCSGCCLLIFAARMPVVMVIISSHLTFVNVMIWYSARRHLEWHTGWKGVITVPCKTYSTILVI